MVFGDLTVLRYAGESMWICVCSCKPDKEIKINGASLRRGLKTHCGCKRHYRKRSEIDFPIEYENKYKPCSKCGLEKEFKEFYFKEYINTEGNKTYYFNPTCIECEIIDAEQWAKDNPEKFKAAVKKYMSTDEFKIWEKEKEERIYHTRVKWRRNNTDKQKVYTIKRKPKKHIIYDEEWNDCKNFFNQRCAYCGLPIEDHYIRYGGKYSYTQQDLQKDHTIFDGKNDLSNCIPGCKSCNISKGEKSLNDWYNQLNPNYTYEKYHQIFLWLKYEYKKHIMPKRRYKGQRINERLKEVELNKQKNK